MSVNMHIQSESRGGEYIPQKLIFKSVLISNEFDYWNLYNCFKETKLSMIITQSYFEQAMHNWTVID